MFNVGWVQEQELITHKANISYPAVWVFFEYSLDGMRGGYNQFLSHGDFICVLDQQESGCHNTWASWPPSCDRAQFLRQIGLWSLPVVTNSTLVSPLVCLSSGASLLLKNIFGYSRSSAMIHLPPNPFIHWSFPQMSRAAWLVNAGFTAG